MLTSVAGPQPASRLTVFVIGGLALKSQDIGKQDPYCRMTVGDKTLSTKVIPRGGRDPVWNERFEFDVMSDDALIVVEAWDRDLLADDLIGRRELPISKLTATNQTVGVNIFDEQNKLAGAIKVQCVLMQNDAAVSAPPAVADAAADIHVQAAAAPARAAPPSSSSDAVPDLGEQQHLTATSASVEAEVKISPAPEVSPAETRGTPSAESERKEPQTSASHEEAPAEKRSISGPLSFSVHRAVLSDQSFVHEYQPEPFVSVSFLDSKQEPIITVQTRAISDGGTKPTWNETLAATLTGTEREVQISVWDKTPVQINLVGTALVDLEDFLREDQYVVHLLDQKTSHPTGDTVEVASIELRRGGGTATKEGKDASAAPAPSPSPVLTPGSLFVTVIRGTNLSSVDFGRQDPYVKVRLGSTVLRTTAVQKGGRNPEWHETLPFTVDGARNKLLVLEAWDADALSDDLIGKASISLVKALEHAAAANPFVCKLEANGNDRGALQLGFRFVSKADAFQSKLQKLRAAPRGTLAITVVRGTSLRNVDFGKVDPFISLIVGRQMAKTRVAFDAGADPTWNEKFSFKLRGGEKTVKLECCQLGDSLIGEQTLSIVELIELGDAAQAWDILSPTGQKVGRIVLVCRFTPFVPKPKARPVASKKAPSRSTVEPGRLSLCVLRGTGFKAFEDESQIAFAQLRLGNLTGVSQPSSRPGAAPVWEEEFQFLLRGTESDVCVDILAGVADRTEQDEQKGSSNLSNKRLVGSVSVPFGSLLSVGPTAAWDVKSPSGEMCGSVVLRQEFISERELKVDTSKQLSHSHSAASFLQRSARKKKVRGFRAAGGKVMTFRDVERIAWLEHVYLQDSRKPPSSPGAARPRTSAGRSRPRSAVKRRSPPEKRPVTSRRMRSSSPRRQRPEHRPVSANSSRGTWGMSSGSLSAALDELARSAGGNSAPSTPPQRRKKKSSPRKKIVF